MKKHALALNAVSILSALSAIVICAGCGDDGGGKVVNSPSFEELTLHDYPKVDGSTSTAPLNAIIACKILGIDYTWEHPGIWGSTRYVAPKLNERDAEIFNERIKSSQTHQSFINLIDGNADLILSARKMSPDEEAHAAAAGVRLIETPVALDAFLFIVNKNNPVNSLTIGQIRDIYTGTVSNWREVGGEDKVGEEDVEMAPYVRNANSGSQELMETMVMNGFNMSDFPVNESELIFSMAGALDAVANSWGAICYTVYYYKEYVSTGGGTVKSLAINGILPNRQTIADKSYPLTAEVYAVIRSDLSPSSTAYKLYEWLQTEAGQQTVSESGYVPRPSADPPPIA